MHSTHEKVRASAVRNMTMATLSFIHKGVDTMKLQMHSKLILLSALILIAAFGRIIPHPYNMSPIAAMGLLGSAYFSRKWMAVLIPFLATWFSDLFINNVIYAELFNGFTWFYEGSAWVYGSYALIIMMGYILLNTVSIARIASSSILATSIFFLITNFGAWIGNPMYPQSFEGLMMSYAAGLPFLQGSFVGDLMYSGILFGGFALAGKTLNISIAKTEQI
ncbi:MAG: hypothetical protein RL734_1700 [Bacteroidota bacterium]|jgi:hypothetical protein